MDWEFSQQLLSFCQEVSLAPIETMSSRLSTSYEHQQLCLYVPFHCFWLNPCAHLAEATADGERAPKGKELSSPLINLKNVFKFLNFKCKLKRDDLNTKLKQKKICISESYKENACELLRYGM